MEISDHVDLSNKIILFSTEGESFVFRLVGLVYCVFWLVLGGGGVIACIIGFIYELYNGFPDGILMPLFASIFGFFLSLLFVMLGYGRIVSDSISRCYIVEEGFVFLCHNTIFDFNGTWYTMNFNEIVLVNLHIKQGSLPTFVVLGEWYIDGALNRKAHLSDIRNAWQNQQKISVDLKIFSGASQEKLVSFLETKNIKVIDPARRYSS